MASPTLVRTLLGGAARARPVWLGGLSKAAKKTARNKAMRAARRRTPTAYVDINSAPPGQYKVLGHREDILSPESARVLRERSHLAGYLGVDTKTLDKVQGYPPIERHQDQLLTNAIYDPAMPKARQPSVQFDRTEAVRKQIDEATGSDLDYLLSERFGGVYTPTIQRPEYYEDIHQLPQYLAPSGRATVIGKPGGVIGRHETMHGMSNRMTDAEARTMPMGFQLSRALSRKLQKSGSLKDAGAIEELIAYSGERGLRHKDAGLSRLLKNRDTLGVYLGHRPRLADAINFTANRPMDVAKGGALVGGGAYGLSQALGGR